MCRGQSDAKPPVFSSRASLVLIYRPTEGLSQLFPAPDLSRGRVKTTRPLGFTRNLSLHNICTIFYSLQNVLNILWCPYSPTMPRSMHTDDK
ncbi:hypothetical protein TNCV_4058041 [Trichonephila clavipes]|nr:hypothetical protein TNCV_4058041 [Trichonephila clavipes]